MILDGLKSKITERLKSVFAYSVIIAKAAQHLFTWVVWLYGKLDGRFRRSKLEKRFAHHPEYAKRIHTRMRRHGGTFRDAEAIGPVMEYSELTPTLLGTRDVFMESGTAIAEFCRYLVLHTKDPDLFVRTNSDLVDEIAKRKKGFTVSRLIGGEGYNPYYMAFYSNQDCVNELIWGNQNLSYARAVIMTASGIDIACHGPHSRKENALFKRYLIQAARRNTDQDWGGSPVIFVTEINKIQCNMPNQCKSIYDWPREPESSDQSQPTEIRCFMRDINDGHICWVIYSCREIRNEQLRKFLERENVTVKELRLPEEKAFAYIVFSSTFPFAHLINTARHLRGLCTESAVQHQEKENVPQKPTSTTPKRQY